MNKKIIFGSIIAVAILIGVSLTSVVGGNMELEKEPCLDITRTIITGIFYLPPEQKDNYSFYAVWVVYNTISPVESERDWGWIILKWVTIPDYRNSAYMGRMYDIGILGIFRTWAFMGDFEIT